MVKDEEVAAHRESLRRLSAPGGPLSPSAPTATVRVPAWFGADGRATGARGELHDRLRAEVRAEQPGVAQERRAVVLAGPPGAGKSSALRQVLGDTADAYLTIDPDEFKGRLLRQAIADGSYESVLKPDEVKELEAAGEKFFPMDLAALVHEESSKLARSLRNEAIERGDNLVIDGVLADEDKALALGQQLQRHGYRVEVVDVEVPYEVSLRSIEQRWQQDYVAALEGRSELGGRAVPEPYVRDVFDGPDGGSRSQHSAAQLAHACPAVHRYRVFRAEAADQPRTVQVDLTRARPDAPLRDAGSGRPVRTRHTTTARHPVARGD